MKLGRHAWRGSSASPSRRARTAIAVAGAAVLSVTGLSVAYAETAASGPGSGVAQRADCGPGSMPETGVQGQVPLADRESGRSELGYSCNLALLGQYQGEGATWVNPSYDHCAYMGTSLGGLGRKQSEGTQVVDVSDPENPRLTANLTSPAMLTDTWETLKVNEERGLLAAVSGGPVVGGLFFDVYDISEDCAHPRLLNSFNATNLTLPANVLGHEGQWAPDGLTYYASGLAAGSLTAIDVADPTRPRIAYTGVAGLPANHGFELSEDGNRLYLTRLAPAGVVVLDVSSIQRRDLLPMIRQVGQVSWSDGIISQQTIPITYRGTPYLVAVDEWGSGGVRFIDISDERNPVVTDNLRLEIQTPEHVDLRRADTTGNGLFGYEAHYCSVNQRIDPTRLACGEFQSGVRVFDIADISEPKEIAYFNPPAQVGQRGRLLGSEHVASVVGQTGFPASDLINGNVGDLTRPLDQLGPPNMTADWCSSPPQFVGPDQLWVTCQDNGFLALEFTNGARA
ncbi:LVIVD repeat-containing protein [Pseudonocardia pini]|uniref:LVIVD repeat-containing protein n=1 Tax=Pseudonocardia pini TaxID=2758030 RepID=UPI001C687B5E|nr:hypothetical protein [Pseudonocardia pini]